MRDEQANRDFPANQPELPPSGDPKKCERCDYFTICRIRLQLGRAEPGMGDRPVQRKHLDKARDLFRAGEPFNGLYAITDGAFKSVVHTEAGVDEIVGFHFPGEYVGLEAFGNGIYGSTVQALEPSWYCSLDTADIKRIGSALVDLQSEIIRNLSLDTRRFQWRCKHLLRATVDQRLASSLLDFARRLGTVEKPLTRFRLPMSRRDIANYLGMAPETLYRAFRKLENEGLVGMEGRTVHIISMPGLNTFGGPAAVAPLQSEDGTGQQNELTRGIAV